MKPSSAVSTILVGLATIAGLVPPAAVAVPPYTVLCEACGGAGGVPFARLRARHGSGQIVLLALPDSSLGALNRQSRLDQALERAGFAVRLVESEQELDASLSAKPADVVLADGADATALRERLATIAAAPVILSVITLSDTTATTLCSVPVAPQEERNFVKLVAAYVSRRQAGTEVDCGPGSG